MSGTLIYSPGVEILIESSIAGPINVSEDASSGSLTLRENGSHSLDITLENSNRKYDGMFIPNDRIVVKMKRFRWLQVFSGYIDSAPYFSTYPGKVRIQAQCTRKVLRYWPWDRGSQKAQELLSRTRNLDAQDAGMSEIVRDLLTEVVEWPEAAIHMGRVPEEWFSKFESVYQRLDDELKVETDPLVGLNPIIAGKPVGNFSLSIASSPVGGSAIGDGEKEKLTIAPSDYEVAMATIRELESGNDYKAINRGDGVGDWATGAYQFIDSTWANYKGYARAYLAPNAIQDEYALSMIRSLIERQGNQLLNIPYGWYYPAVFSDPSWLDKIPAANEGNTLTLRQYGYKWVDTYVQKYIEMRGSQPTPGSPTDGNIVDSSATTSILYPIPAGVVQLKSTEVGALAYSGQYSNGYVPSTAMRYTKYTGMGHPVAVDAWEKLSIAAERDGINVRGYMYRSYEDQVALSSGAGATPGRSNHGWGLAIDVQSLVNAQNRSGFAAAIQSPEYQWLQANAYKYGFGHPDWARDPDRKPEAWHWEFFAIYAIGQTVNGVNPFGAEGSGLDSITGDTTFSRQLFSALAGWTSAPQIDPESTTLSGYKALMNDEPILATIEQFVKASGRNYCMAPNGDFIAWFPDYWGEYGIAGKMQIESIELKDFSVQWADQSLITHQFVEGATVPGSFGPAPTGIIDGIQSYLTRGVATVDMPNLLASILNVRNPGEYPWLTDPDKLLSKFGARVSRLKNPMISGPHQEFFYAVAEITRAWAAQFSTVAPLTFMPELFPGMLMEIPLFGVQMYVTSVTHRWDMTNKAGFSTDVQTMAVSATDGSGFYLFPKGGAIAPAGSSNSTSPSFDPDMIIARSRSVPR